MAKHFFLRVIWEGSKTRVRPIPGQHVYVGASSSVTQLVNSDYNVSCDKEFRTAVPVNTIVATDKLVLAPGGMHYTAGQIILMEPTTHATSSSYPLATGQIFQEFLDTFGISYEDYKAGGAEEKPIVAEEKAPESAKRTFMSRLHSNKKYAPPTIEDDGFYIDEAIWYFVVRLVLRGEPLLLTGPTGCGKTELLSLVASKLGHEAKFVDMGGMLDGISGLVGVHRIEKGDSAFDFAPFANYVQNPGFVVLDELNRAPITTNNILFPCLDFRRTLPASLASSKQMRDIEIHEDCYIAGTSNKGHQYTGTSIIDRALEDRFTEVQLDYLSPDLEVSLLEKRTKVSNGVATHLVKILSHIRDTYKSGELSNSISTRHALRAAQYASDGIGIYAAMEFAFLPMFEGSRTEGERALVHNIIYAK